MELNEIVNGIVNDKISDIHTCLPAKIEDYDHETMYAKVVLLPKKELESEMEEITPIIDVPVSHLKAGNFIIRPPYAKDDTVLVAFSEAGLDKLLITGEPEEPQFSRKFSYDDAIVLQGLKTEQEDDYPVEEADGLYISHLDENNKFIFHANGDMRLINEAIEGGEKVPAKFAEILMDNQKNIEINREDPDAAIDTHIHLEENGTFIVEDEENLVKIEKEENGNIVIEDMDNGTKIELDHEGAGDLIFTLANMLFLGSQNADEGVPLGDSLKEWLDNHSHPSDGSPPSSESPDPSKKVMVE